MTNPDEPSGIYECINCGQKETHVEGKPFAPCSKCGSNDWRIVEKTND